MGREIRRVPPNWEHPKDEKGDYIPMNDQEYESRAREWLDNCIAWDNGTHEDLREEPELKERYLFFWEWGGGPPKPDWYRPKFTEEPTWVQMYENVSEGTPVTPPFASKAELVDYLVEHGTFWDDGGWNRENAERFVEREYAPSMIFNASTGEIQTPKEM